MPKKARNFAAEAAEVDKAVAEVKKQELVRELDKKNTKSMQRSKRKSKPLVLTDVLERPSSEERADQETKSLKGLSDALDKLAEEYGQLALQHAMQKKFADLPSSGQGMSKKQLNQIILDKNRVIADLEETAYSKGKGLSKPKSMNKWIAHVKEYAKKHGCSYATALKEAKATYKK
jgi:hypothetical protein